MQHLYVLKCVAHGNTCVFTSLNTIGTDSRAHKVFTFAHPAQGVAGPNTAWVLLSEQSLACSVLLLEIATHTNPNNRSHTHTRTHTHTHTQRQPKANCHTRMRIYTHTHTHTHAHTQRSIITYLSSVGLYLSAAQNTQAAHSQTLERIIPKTKTNTQAHVHAPILNRTKDNGKHATHTHTRTYTHTHRHTHTHAHQQCAKHRLNDLIVSLPSKTIRHTKCDTEPLMWYHLGAQHV